MDKLSENVSMRDLNFGGPDFNSQTTLQPVFKFVPTNCDVFIVVVFLLYDVLAKQTCFYLFSFIQTVVLRVDMQLS